MDFPPIRRRMLDTLQVNLGSKCNQSCPHCRVAASPQRTEMMNSDTVAQMIEVLRVRKASMLDLTGGAPQLNEHFRHLDRREPRLPAVMLTDGQDACSSDRIKGLDQWAVHLALRRRAAAHQILEGSFEHLQGLQPLAHFR